jgi:hypothetical protein
MKQQMLEEENRLLKVEIATLKRREFWLEKGTITENFYGDRYKIGDPERQLSDGPAGRRSYSVDFADLEECLRFASGSIIHFE